MGLLTLIEVSYRIDQPTDVVWEAVADLESHVDWMKDAISLKFADDRRSGVGTKMQVETRVGPFRTLDIMEVTDWIEGRRIGVEHSGLVTGRGSLSVHPDGAFTVVTWSEQLVFPWWLGGPLTGWVAKPILRSVWRGNLRRLEESLTA